MINIMKKIKIKRNTKNLELASLKEELLNTYRKIEEKNQKILELLEIKNTQQFHIEELNNEIKELRERKIRKVK